MTSRRPSAGAPSRPPAKDPVRAEQKRLKRLADPEAEKQRGAQRHADRSPAEKLERVWRQLARPPTPRPGSKNSEVARRAALARAYYTWSDLDEVFRMYQAAAVMTELFGEEYVVDHMVPMLSPLVCGLHVHSNLRVLKKSENTLKSNVFWPQMPEYGWETMKFLTDSAENR